MKANDIAVLYFDDRSPDRSLRYLSDGLTEALIHELGTVKALNVTSRNGVAPFKGKDIGAGQHCEGAERRDDRERHRGAERRQGPRDRGDARRAHRQLDRHA